MKVFISWSGNKSQKVAEILKKWIPCVIQSVKPYFSSADIDKGARWSTDIAKELQDASFGILCVTRDNISSTWLNFEAGALSRSIEQSKVCPFLVDLKPSDIPDSPILQFQMANTTRKEVFRLFESLNANLGDEKLNEDVLITTFESFWPKMEEAFQSVSTNDPVTPLKKSSKDTQAPLEEILELVRYQYKLLKSPKDLLPAEYLSEVLTQSTPAVSRDFFAEIDDELRDIFKLTSNAIRGCKLHEDIVDLSECIDQLGEIQDRIKKLGQFVRRKIR